MERLRVTYRLGVPAGEAEARAEVLAREQTVEVPRVVVRERFVEEHVLGRVESIAPDPAGGQRAVVAYPAETTAFDPAQLLNVIFGNSSLHADVECVDAELPPSLLRALAGPRFGIEGLRQAAGARGRPLTCTAVKPMGRSPEQLAALLRTFARAGIDVVKDDHGLADQPFCPFEARVTACLAAAEEVAQQTGHHTVYAPNLVGPPAALLRQLRFAQDRGARAVLVSPMLVGLPAFWELCRQHARVPVLAHPAFGGAPRLAPELLFGKLFRLFGADAVIFVSFGSRFAAEREACRRLARTLTAPWGPVAPALPVPAGGIELANADEVAAFYGRDCMLLVGGSLQVEAGDDAILERGRAFVRAVCGAAAHAPASAGPTPA